MDDDLEDELKYDAKKLYDCAFDLLNQVYTFARDGLAIRFKCDGEDLQVSEKWVADFRFPSIEGFKELIEIGSVKFALSAKNWSFLRIRYRNEKGEENVDSESIDVILDLINTLKREINDTLRIRDNVKVEPSNLSLSLLKNVKTLAENRLSRRFSYVGGTKKESGYLQVIEKKSGDFRFPSIKCFRELIKIENVEGALKDSNWNAMKICYRHREKRVYSDEFSEDIRSIDIKDIDVTLDLIAILRRELDIVYVIKGSGQPELPIFLRKVDDYLRKARNPTRYESLKQKKTRRGGHRATRRRINRLKNNLKKSMETNSR